MTPPPAAAARLDSASLPLPEKKSTARAAPARADRPFRGIALILASTVFLGASDVTAKYLSATLPSIEIAWIRFLVFSLIMVPAMLPGSPLFALRTKRPGLQAMRGVALVTAATLVAEIGDFRRFAGARQLMAYLGQVPSENSSGERVRRGGITKAGNARVRRVLTEAAWTYRSKPGTDKTGTGAALKRRRDALPPAVCAIAAKAEARLTARFRHLLAAGKLRPVAVTAVAREMVGFLWAIANAVDSPQAASSRPEPAAAPAI